MNIFKELTNRHHCGHWKCRYCGAKPKDRPLYRRRARRVLKIMDDQYVQHEMCMDALHPAEIRAIWAGEM